MEILHKALKQKGAFLKTLKALVELETPTQSKVACDKLASFLVKRLRNDSWQVERIAKEAVGDQLIASLPARANQDTLLLGHYDTVWPLNTLAAMPFKQEGDYLYGPGILDMKGGIAIALHAPSLIEKLDKKLMGKLTLLLTSDEETGSYHSRELIEQLSKEHERVFVLEPSPQTQIVKVGRKGCGSYLAEFKGIAAHAGNNPQDGASALRELAHFLLFVEDLNNESDTSVNLTVASGGSASNVIAEQAKAEVDFRVPSLDEFKQLQEAISNYKVRDKQVAFSLTGGLDRPPLDFTESNKKLFEKARTCAQNLGFDLTGKIVGGGSDGNFSSALGIPTLDGLGAVGKGMHARLEHIHINDTLKRLALISMLISL